MAVITEYIEVSTKGKRDVIDITPEMNKIIKRHSITEGTVTVFAPGSTAAVTTIEYEPGLKKDIDVFLEKIIPYNGKYHHHETWNDDNGSSHVQAAIIGPSLSIPMVNGTMTLGTWQQVVLVDCDTRSRDRELVMQIVY